MRTPSARSPGTAWTEPAQRLKRLGHLAAMLRHRLRERYWLRLHVFTIALITLGGMWLASALLMQAGIERLALRYGLAFGAAYLLYLGVLRLWCGWLAHGRSHGDSLEVPDLPNLSDGTGRPTGSTFESGGGGDCGGGGASGSWDPAEAAGDGLVEAAGEGVAQATRQAASVLDGADEGIVLLVPLAVLLGIVAALSGLLGLGVLSLFGVEVLLAVTVEVVLASLAGSVAYKGFTEGWLASAVGHTWRGALVVLATAVLLGAAIDHWLPGAQSLAQALGLIQAGF
jgi:hypothetical protein